MQTRFKLASLVLALTLSAAAQAETIRVAVGTQDTTINCATGGLLLRELHLLEKYLPHDGKYKDAQYDIQWKNFTSGAPLTNEMVAGKLDFGSMADFPGSLNGASFEKAGKKSLFINVLSGSVTGSGNGIVVPNGSTIRSVADLKGKTVSVPFASTAHGLLLRVIKAQGWEVDKDITVLAQAPEVAGSALQSNKVDAHADFVPFAELFPYKGFARKIYDGAQSNTPTFHGSLVAADYAKQYPEIVVAYERAVIEADRLIAAEPEKYSELIAKVTGIPAEVVYLFHGPLGLQTRDLSWKPEYRQATQTAINTLKLLKKTDVDLNVNEFINDSYVRAAYKQAGLDYDKQLANYAKLPLNAKDAHTGKPITNADLKRVAQIWVQGEAKVRHYASPESAFADLTKLEKAGKHIRVVYVQDRSNGVKLLANQAWFVKSGKGEINAFLLKGEADAWATKNGGKVADFGLAKARTLAVAAL
jgi:NitT/TauT family transport system substrate-binding protein